MGPTPPEDSYNMHSTPTTDKTNTGAIGKEIPQLERVPEIYRDLWRVFSEKECDSLPPHRATDCAIELKSGVTLAKPRMHSMTSFELNELRRYINHNLARGFIKPSRSHMVAPVLFKEKKDGGLRLYIDFRGLMLCVWNPYILYPL